ncbi:MAG: hypothetical protein BV457_00120 [Thermoplasmata archaeon M9B1D]|nr:MAG: hypothetical protein BV457_00120 [Thermoplasmata archaeon M9B1D]PNX52230.1 MAG: hypothetical protein BV456_00175 [Thermoplasmata archaeon M8B2D]
MEQLSVNQLSSAIVLITSIGAIYGGFWAIIKSAIKPMQIKIENIEKKVMPTINAMKTFLSSKGVKIQPKTGEYIGDLSNLYDAEEDEFVDKMRIILDEFHSDIDDNI